MAADAKAKAEKLLDSIRPDIIRAWAGAIPDFGDLSLSIHFVDGQPIRIDWAARFNAAHTPC